MKINVLNSRRFLCWIFISVCVAFFSGVGKAPDIIGDGVEYLLMTQAFVGRGAVSLHQSDVQGFLAERGNHSIANAHQLIYPGILNNSPPFYKAESGRVYSYHFWLVSVAFSPFVLLARSLGMADTSGYLFANLFLVCLTMFCFFRFGRRGGWAIAGCVLYLSVGAVYYIRWPHPEVFSASLLCIALLFFRDGFNRTAAFILAFAGQQNPPILLLIPVVFAVDARIFFREKIELLEFFKAFFLWGLIAAFAVLSSVFNYTEFGVLNLISAKGFAYSDLVSLHRLISIYFDPNIGVLWVVPFALVVLAAFFVFAKRSKDGIRWGWVSLFLVMSVICAVPSLSTTNWNSGAAIVSRYGFWCSIPLVLAILEVLKDFEGRRGQLVLLAMASCQVGLMANNGGAFHRRGDQEFSSIARLLLNHAPWLYFPVPQIFVERGQNAGGVEVDRVYYWSKSGSVNKILFNRFRRGFAVDVCSFGDPREYITSVNEVESGWVYWSLKEGCSVKASDGFHATKPIPVVRAGQYLGTSSTAFADGWSRDEVTARWSLGKRSVLKFRAEGDLKTVAISGFVFGSQRVGVLLNDALYYSGDAPGNGIFLIDLTAAPAPKEGVHEIVFYWPDARPWDDADRRELAFSVNNITFN